MPDNRGQGYGGGVFARFVRGYAGYLFALGGERGQVQGQVEKRFPDVPPSWIDARITEASRAVSAAGELLGGPPARRLRREQIPIDPDIPERYRHAVVIHWGTDLPPDQQAARTFMMDTSRLITHQELVDTITSWIIENYVDLLGSSELPPGIDPGDWFARTGFVWRRD